MNSILPLLNKFVPIGLAIKGIEKINPKLKNFITAATGAGYGMDQVLDYLRNKVENPNYIEHANQLERGNQAGTLRPDEQASLARIRQQEQVPNAIQSAASLGAGALGGGIASALTGEAKPEKTEEELLKESALQGGKEAVTSANEKILQDRERKDFYRKNGLYPEDLEKTVDSAFANFMLQNKELGEFLQKQINNGFAPDAAALRAKTIPKFRQAIRKLEDDVGQPLENLLLQLFQGSPQSQNVPKQGTASGSQQASSIDFSPLIEATKRAGDLLAKVKRG